jgi:hypothetical protein
MWLQVQLHFLGRFLVVVLVRSLVGYVLALPDNQAFQVRLPESRGGQGRSANDSRLRASYARQPLNTASEFTDEDF